MTIYQVADRPLPDHTVPQETDIKLHPPVNTIAQVADCPSPGNILRLRVLIMIPYHTYYYVLYVQALYGSFRGENHEPSFFSFLHRGVPTTPCEY